MSMYTHFRNYHSPSRKGQAEDRDRDADTSDARARESSGTGTNALSSAIDTSAEIAGTTTGFNIRSSISHEGSVRGRILQSHGISGDRGYRTYSSSGYYSATVPRQASALVSGGLPIMSPMPSTVLPRQDQELFGISESRPSSPSSANDRAAVVKTPTFEYYGFVIYLVSLASFVVYLLWAYLPNDALDAIGITYYPDRYWALALPAWWLTAVAFAYLFNMAANMYNTPLLNSMDNITDPYSNMPSDMEKASEFYSNEVGGIPPVSDLPISLVNRCLYE
ncbi:hypothetical protein H4R99_003566 [Coemansia sp. RSA 1722]|nr:hypothetical protein IWW45_003908 [Coemansia sp. RSA 485]KAJ2599812.1 hypothetical protein H4R99_003566 [Coemansia sp. RSA 1722]